MRVNVLSSSQACCKNLLILSITNSRNIFPIKSIGIRRWSIKTVVIKYMDSVWVARIINGRVQPIANWQNTTLRGPGIKWFHELDRCTPHCFRCVGVCGEALWTKCLGINFLLRYNCLISYKVSAIFSNLSRYSFENERLNFGMKTNGS